MYPSGSDGQINQRSVEEKIEQETERNHALHEAFYDAQMVHDEIESKLIKARRQQQELENKCDAAIDLSVSVLKFCNDPACKFGRINPYIFSSEGERLIKAIKAEHDELIEKPRKLLKDIVSSEETLSLLSDPTDISKADTHQWSKSSGKGRRSIYLSSTKIMNRKVSSGKSSCSIL